MKEVWKDVVGFEGKYQVSNLGRVKSLSRLSHGPTGRRYLVKEKILKLHSNIKSGYLIANINSHPVSLHTLLLEAFIGPRPKGMECRHLDGNRKNNNLSNLCWGTVQENANDRVKHGTTNRGRPSKLRGKLHWTYNRKFTREHCERIADGAGKLSHNDVRLVRNMRSSGHTYKSIADKFGVTDSTIRSLCHGKTWRHVL